MFSHFQSIRKKLFSIGHFESAVFNLGWPDCLNWLDAEQDLLSFPVAHRVELFFK